MYLWKVVDIKSNEKPEKSNNKQRKAVKSSKSSKSNEEQRKAKMDMGAEKNKTGNKRHKKSKWETRLNEDRQLMNLRGKRNYAMYQDENRQGCLLSLQN